MSFRNLQPASFTLDQYVLSRPPNSRSKVSLSSKPSNFELSWSGLGLDAQVVENLDIISHPDGYPEELHRRIIRCVLLAHHLEIIVPPESNTTTALDAALITLLASQPASVCAPAPVAAPLVLVLCMTPDKADRHSLICAGLATGVQGLPRNCIHRPDTLSADLVALSGPVERPLVVTTLARAAVLLDRSALSLARLAVLTLDLRGPAQLTHHTVAELEPLLARVGPHVQIVLLLGASTRVHPALPELIGRQMDTSIRRNLGEPPPLTNSAASTSPTPLQTPSSVYYTSPRSNILGPIPASLDQKPTVAGSELRETICKSEWRRTHRNSRSS